MGRVAICYKFETLNTQTLGANTVLPTDTHSPVIYRAALSTKPLAQIMESGPKILLIYVARCYGKVLVLSLEGEKTAPAS